MKRISKLLCIILVLGIFILMNQITANADLSDAVTSCEFKGASGQELTYTLNYTTGVMEISGEGAMLDYEHDNSQVTYAPWREKRDFIKKVIIQEGITRIGDNAFSSCSLMTEISIPSTVTSIGESVFHECMSLKSIQVDSSNTAYTSENGHLFNKAKTSMLCYAAANCVDTYMIPSTVTTIKSLAFRRSNAKTVIVPSSVTTIEELAFSTSSIEEVRFQDGSKLKTIGDNAFDDSQIKNLVIPSSVTTIGGYIVYSCDNLENIYFTSKPSSMNEYMLIGFTGNLYYYSSSGWSTSNSYNGNVTWNNVSNMGTMDGVYWSYSSSNILKFSGNGAIPDITTENHPWLTYLPSTKSLILEEGITSIGDYAFKNTNTITSLTIPNTVTHIGDMAFNGWNGITTVTIPNSVTSMECAFMGCTALKTVTLSSGLKDIPSEAFKYCTSLYSIQIPETIDTIGERAFLGCSALEKVTIEDGVYSIGKNAFNGCTKLTSITLPESVSTIGSSVFYGSGISELNIDSNNPYFKSSNGVLYNKDMTELIWYPATKSYTNFTIPEGVKKIGTEAFYNADQLTSITFPNTLISIGENAFSHCDNIITLDFPDNLGTIKTKAFYSCTSLSKIDINSNLQSIEENAFTYCSNLAAVSIAENNQLKSLGSSVFYGTAWLNNQTSDFIQLENILIKYQGSATSVIIPSTVSIVADNAFISNTAITSITVPNTVSYIGSNAFSDCTNLVNVTIQSNSIEYGTNVFYKTAFANNASEFVVLNNTLIQYNGSSSKVEIPDGITHIDAKVFKENTTIKEVTLPESVISIGSEAFYNCTNLEKINLPDGITTINSNAFNGCSSLNNIVLPESLSYIGTYAFSNCNLMTELIFNENVSFIGNHAFYKCNNISYILFKGNAPDIDSYGFSSLNATAVYPKNDSWTKNRRINYSGVIDWRPYCGDNLYSRLENGTLTITGTGSMYDFSLENYNECPWYGLYKEITTIVLPDGITSIGTHAFRGLNYLQTLTIPNTVTNIASSAFAYCYEVDLSLEEGNADYVIEDGVLYNIDKTNLLHYSGLNKEVEKYEIPGSVTTIEPYAFSSCFYNINSIIIPGTVKTISEYAFDNTDIENITLENGITTIGDYAFKDAYYLEKITIPSSVTNIGTKAIGYLFNEKVDSFVISGYSNSAGETYANEHDFAFVNLSTTGTCGEDISWTLEDDGTFVLNGSGIMTNYTADSTLPWDANKDKITSLIIDADITSIGDYAFYNCTNLENVYIQGDVPTIGTRALGNTKVDITNLATHEHMYVEGEITKEATCEDTGTRTDICSGCRLSKITVLDKLGHKEGDWKIITNPTCNTSGLKKKYCVNANCNKELETEEIPAKNNHTYKEIITNPTCTKDGSKIYKCTGCNTVDETKTVIIKATGHSGTWKQVKVPTCLNNGFGRDDKYCDKCGILIDQRSYLGSTDHVWGEWELQAEQDVFGPEVQIRTCTVCHNAQDKKIIGESIKPTIKVNYTSIPLQKGKSTTKIKVTGLAKNDYIESWTSNKKSVATVNRSGKITGKKVGTAKITVKLASGLKKTITVKVQKDKVKANYITMVGTNKFTLKKGEKLDLPKTMKLTLIPVTTQETIKYSSSNSKIASVNSKGVVTAKKPGKVKITMIPGSNKKNKDDTITITVPKVTTTKITLNKTEITLKKGKTYTLKATLTPSNSDGGITFKSSTKSVATISSNGKIKAKKKGTTMITVTSGKKKVTCKVTVK